MTGERKDMVAVQKAWWKKVVRAYGIASRTIVRSTVPLVLVGLNLWAPPSLQGNEPVKTAITSAAPKVASTSGNFSFDNARPDDVLLPLSGNIPESLKSGLRVRVTDSNGIKWLLPVYVLKAVQLPKEGCREVKVSLCDALYDDSLDLAITQAMDTKFGKDAWKKATPNENGVAVTLRITQGKRDTLLGTVEFTREVDKRQHVLRFPLDPVAAGQVLATDSANLGITIDERYAGTFKDAEILAVATASSNSATRFKDMLRADPSGRQATLLVAVGGGIGQNVSISQQFSRQVAVGVWSKAGASVNETMVDNLVAKLFAGVTEDVVLATQREDTIVTFLTSNGMKVTASIGTFTGMKDHWKSERASVTEKDDASSWERRRKLAGEAGGWGAAVKFETDNHDSASVSSRAKEEFRAMDEVMKNIEGALPVAVMNADQVQKLVSRASSETKVEIGQFSEGWKLLQHRQSLERAFEIVAERAAPKSESDRFRERASQLVKELEVAEKKLTEATASRDAIAKEYKPLKDKLTALQTKTKQANEAAAAANKRHEESIAFIEERYFNLGPFVNAEEWKRTTMEKMNFPEMRTAVKETKQAAANLEDLLRTFASSVSGTQAKLETAEQEVAKAAPLVTKLKAEQAAMRRLLNQDGTEKP